MCNLEAIFVHPYNLQWILYISGSDSKITVLAGDKVKCYQLYISGYESVHCPGTTQTELKEFSTAIEISTAVGDFDALVEIIDPGQYTQWTIKVQLRTNEQYSKILFLGNGNISHIL